MYPSWWSVIKTSQSLQFRLRLRMTRLRPASIVTRALEAPLTAIAMNSGESASKIISELRRGKEKGGNAWTGFNAMTNGIGDLKEAGIIDPLKVVKVAFTNAVSVASNYLMMGAAATDIPEKNAPAGGMGGGMPGMGGMDY